MKISSGLKTEKLEIDDAVFHLRPLNTFELFECMALGSDPTKVGAMFEAICGHAIVKWEGIEDENGPVDYNEATLKFLPPKVVAEVANHILESNNFGAEDEKN